MDNTSELDQESDKMLELEILTSNLLTKKANEGLLKALFGRSSGEWVRVDSLCSEIEDHDEVTKVATPLNLFVLWSPMPEPERADAYAVIIFYCVELAWNSFAMYNRNVLNMGAG